MVTCLDVTVRKRAASDLQRDDRERADAAERHRRMGRVITLRREELGLSQQQLADRLGVNQTRISKMERGEGWTVGKGDQVRPHGWPVHLMYRVERELRMNPGTLNAAGGYVPAFDLDSAVRTAPDILESDKAMILAVLKEARKKTGR